MGKYQIKDVVGYEGLYQVDTEGNVFTLNYKHTGERRKMRTGANAWGYLQVTLCKDGKQKNCKVHRLVAEAFIPNPNNLPCINHKDECKTNNLVDNLEFCTYKYNLEYSGNHIKGAKAAAKTNSKAVLQLTKNGNFVAEYPSAKEAAYQTGIVYKSITKCCRGVKYYKSAGGYKWKYKE